MGTVIIRGCLGLLLDLDRIDDGNDSAGVWRDYGFEIERRVSICDVGANACIQTSYRISTYHPYSVD